MPDFAANESGRDRVEAIAVERSTRPSRTVTSRLQLSGQSSGQALVRTSSRDSDIKDHLDCGNLVRGPARPNIWVSDAATRDLTTTRGRVAIGPSTMHNPGFLAAVSPVTSAVTCCKGLR